MDVLDSLPDEDYVLQRAKLALKTDPLYAKAWMITAKCLYPDNFGVQFEAYNIEKNAGHVKEAAKCFSDLIIKFQQQPDLWKEIEKVTTALRAENDANDPENQFLCEMFKHISLDVQHKLLLFTADRCEDTMEHCRLLLLLLQRFPTAISSYGPRLVDTLLSAEKHSHAGNQPINPYRKLLVCDLLPLLGMDGVTVELNQKLLFKLLHKAIEFYLYCCGMLPNTSQELDFKIDDGWSKLYSILELIGKYLNWERYLTNLGTAWTKESYWQKIITFCQSPSFNFDDHSNVKQLLYCATIFFLNCLNDYNASLTPDSAPGQVQTTYLLVEAFVDQNLPNPTPEPKAKRRKSDTDANTPFLTIERPENKVISSTFIMAVNGWDLLNSSEHLHREFVKLNSVLKLDTILSKFLIDYSIYKGRYDDALMRVQQETSRSLIRDIRAASLFYIKKSFGASFEHVLQILDQLPLSNTGCLSNLLITGGTQRHLHFLPLTKIAVLQYCVKLLLRSIKEKYGTTFNELAIGNMLALIQYDWPQEMELVPTLMEQIRQKGSFHYYCFQNYIVNVDILEEITYLWTSQGGQITLDIIPHLGQRRIGTRGSDKGAKEEIKQAIRRQVLRCNEPLDDIIIKFLNQERGNILQTLI